MSHFSLAFFGFSQHRKDDAAFVRKLIELWPNPVEENEKDREQQQNALPDVRYVRSVEAFMENGWPDQREPSACVIAIKDAELDAQFFTLLDRLTQLAIPAIVLAENYGQVADRLMDDEVIVCPASEPLPRLALRLHALASRQHIIRQLRRDLLMARRCQGGLHGEIIRIEEELQLAAMIQREFLPKKLPDLAEVRFGVLFRPAGYVSGDIYHIERLDENHIAFFLADAVGHGVPAALMTMVIAHSLTMKEIGSGSYRIIPPGEVLAHLNDSIISHHAENGRFATAVYGLVDVRDYKITIAAAGHPPPLKIDRHGESEYINGAGGLLGVFPDEHYDEISFTLEPGDRFFIYSDGFEMAFPDRDDFKLDKTPGSKENKRRLPTLRYIDEIRKACKPGLDVDETIASLRHAVDRQPGSLHQVDDLTGICVSRLTQTAAKGAPNQTNTTTNTNPTNPTQPLAA